jgi:fumarylacetoacetase
MTNPSIDATHAPDLKSWVASANGEIDFPVQNLPLGVCSPKSGDGARICSAIGDKVVDLRALADEGHFDPRLADALGGTTLNALFALPAEVRQSLRSRLSALLSDPAHQAGVEPHLHDQDLVTMQLPAAIGDYTDFYVGINHATNVGKLFRPDNPLLPNYKYVPIGYHGRASSIRVSGEPVLRPNGQTKSPDQPAPIFGPSRRLDYEMELCVWIGEGNPLGQPIPISEAGRHIAGYSLLNDWSARDFQTWEYQPLGPFLAKNFHSTISPWVITAEALAPFRIAQPPRPAGDPAPLPYLFDADDQQNGNFAIDLVMHLSSARMREAQLPPALLSQSASAHMYWTFRQIVTHHASNGCDLRTGDLLGTGTISAPGTNGYGSIVELTAAGTTPLELPTGERRSFIEDGDELIYTAVARADGFVPIGFGPCRAIILPAR